MKRNMMEFLVPSKEKVRLYEKKRPRSGDYLLPKQIVSRIRIIATHSNPSVTFLSRL